MKQYGLYELEGNEEYCIYVTDNLDEAVYDAKLLSVDYPDYKYEVCGVLYDGSHDDYMYDRVCLIEHGEVVA